MKKLTEAPGLISYLIFHWRAMSRLNRLWASNEYVEVISLCDLMLNKNQNDYLAYYYRGLANEKLNRFELAIDDLLISQQQVAVHKRKALVKEFLTGILIQLSRVYRKSQDKQNALDYADKAVQADKREVVGLKWRASLKEDFGDYLGASEDLNEALTRRPNDKSLVKLRDHLTYIIIENRRETASR